MKGGSDPVDAPSVRSSGRSGIAARQLQDLVTTPRLGLHVPDSHHLIMSVPVMGFAAGVLHARVLVVVVGSTWVMTCRPSRVPASSDLVDAIGARLAAAGPVGPGTLFSILLDEVVDQLWDLGDDLDDRLADAERASLDDPDAAHRTLQSLRHDILVLHRAVGPLRRMLARVDDSGIAEPAATQVVTVRRSHDAVVELRRQIDTQLLLLNGLSQTQVLAASHRGNEVMQATSSWGAILVVATLITGIYGMNFRSMPELTWELGYPFAIMLIVGSTVVLYRMFRSRGWL